MKKTLRKTRERGETREILRVEFNWLLSHRTSHKEEKKNECKRHSTLRGKSRVIKREEEEL